MKFNFLSMSKVFSVGRIGIYNKRRLWSHGYQYISRTKSLIWKSFCFKQSCHDKVCIWGYWNSIFLDMPYGSICSNSKPIHSIHMSNNLSWIYLWKLETKLCDKLSTAKLQHIFIIPHSISTINRSSFSLICPIIKIDSMRPKAFSSISIRFLCIR